MKRHVRNIFKIITFLIGIAIIWIMLENVLCNKESERKFKTFYEEENEFDVLFTGISHTQDAISPMELYNDYGITSFNLGESGERIYYAYYILKNALEYTMPKLVVIDVLRLEDTEVEYTEYLHVLFDSMPLGKTKCEVVNDLIPSEEKVEILFPLLAFHERWKDLNKYDFVEPSFRIRLDKGTRYYEDSGVLCVPYNNPVIDEDDKLPAGQLTEKYLRMMIEMCQNKKIDVLLINYPYLASEEQQRIANGAADIADEYGIKFLNLMYVDNLIDYETDLYDYGHVNCSGMKKITDYIGTYLKENYHLPDRREDIRYSSWENDYIEYTKYKYMTLNYIDRLDRYMVLLADKNTSCCIYINNEIKLDNQMIKLIQNLCDENIEEKISEAANSGNDYFLVIDNTDYSIIQSLGEDIQASTSFGDLLYGHDKTGNPYLFINSSNYSKKNLLDNNCNIVILSIDKFTGNIEDIAKWRWDSGFSTNYLREAS